MKAELTSPDKPTPIVIKNTNDNDIFKANGRMDRSHFHESL
jgi:hypothetical protein